MSRFSPRGVALLQLLVASSLSLLLLGLVTTMFWSTFRRARLLEDCSERQRKTLFELDHVVADLGRSAPEGVRMLEGGALLVVPQVPTLLENQRRWSRAAIAYQVNAERKTLVRAQQVVASQDYATGPVFPPLVRMLDPGPGWIRMETPGFVRWHPEVQADSVRVQVTLEILRLDGTLVPVELTRWGRFSI